MTKGLDHLLPCQHLLYVAIDFAEILLLAAEMEGRTLSEFSGHEHHHQRHHKHQEREGNGEHHHARKSNCDGDEGGEHHWNAAANHLTERIDIVRID